MESSTIVIAIIIVIVLVVIICLYPEYALLGVAVLGLAGLAWFRIQLGYRDQKYSGAGWVCDPLREYQERCHDDPEVEGFRTKQICENSCLREDEKFPSVENIIKFTSNINFPIPKAFLLEIDRDPSSYHKFMNGGWYDLVKLMINQGNLDEFIARSITNVNGMSINHGTVSFGVLVSDKKYDNKFIKKLGALLEEAEKGNVTETYMLYSTYYRQYNPNDEFNVAWPLIAANLQPAQASSYDSSFWRNARQLIGKADLTLLQVNIRLDFSHATFLLLDNKNKKAQYFDSNILVIDPLYKELRTLFPEYDFTSPVHENCPIGLQGASHGDSYCQTWSVFVQHLYILNYGKPLQEFLGYLLSIGPYAKDIMFAYSFYLYTSYKDTVLDLDPKYSDTIESAINLMHGLSRKLRYDVRNSSGNIREYSLFLMGINKALKKVLAGIVSDPTYVKVVSQDQIMSALIELSNEVSSITKQPDVDVESKMSQWKKKIYNPAISEYVQDAVKKAWSKHETQSQSCILF